MLTDSSHQPQEVILAKFSMYVDKRDLNPIHSCDKGTFGIRIQLGLQQNTDHHK